MAEFRHRTLVIECSREIECAPETLIETILSPATWPSWQSEILATDGPARIAKGNTVSGRARLLGFEVEGQSTAVEIEDGFYEQDVLVGVRMRVRYEVKAGPRGSLVTHRLTSQLPAGTSGRILSFFLAPRLRHMQRRLLRELAAQARSAPLS